MSYEKSTENEKLFFQSRRSMLLAYPNYVEICEDAIETFDLVTDTMLLERSKAADCTAADLMSSSNARAWDSIKYLHIQYSAGISINKLRIFLPVAIHYWEEFSKYDEAYDKTAPYVVAHIPLGDDTYWDAIRLTSFAILLGFTNDLHRLCAIWDYGNQPLDGLLERLVAPFVSGRDAPPDEYTRHLPYFKLLKVFSVEPDKRSALMAKYMDDWYEASRREPYYKSHTKGREHNFLGYWAFEAAAVTYVLDIDDSSYRDHEFYPRDLIDFARSLPRPLEIGGEAAQLKLRCPAGEPCPKTGYWSTPAKLGSRQHFKQGDSMPDFPGSTYGVTIWQWDQHQN